MRSIVIYSIDCNCWDTTSGDEDGIVLRESAYSYCSVLGDRTYQEALQVGIADKIAAKETLQVGKQQLSKSVNSVSKKTSSRGISRSWSTSRPSPNQPSPKFQPVSSYACLSRGNSGHERSKCKFRNAVFRHCKLRGHIARVCKKGGVDNMGFEE